MKINSQCLRKISLVSLFLTQGALLIILSCQFSIRQNPILIENDEEELFYEYYESEFGDVYSLEDLILQEKEKEAWLSSNQAWSENDHAWQDDTIDEEWRKKDNYWEKDVDDDFDDRQIHDLYLETDYDELKKDPIQEDLKHTYVYQLPKQNLAYMNKLFQRADLCEDAWSQEVDDFILILQQQNADYLKYGDAEVKELATIQHHLSVALEEMNNETNETTIDLVKRCYKSYENYYFSKFDWGNAI